MSAPSVGTAVEEPGVRVHRAARVEDLLEPLVAWIHRTLPDDPIVPIRIVVQSAGMQRWLAHQLAMRLGPSDAGVTAGFEFPFPGRLVHDVARACGTTAEADDPWSADRLVWEVCRVLVAHTDEPSLADLRRGASDDLADGVISRRTWRLARQVADVFDRYTLYRPQMVSAWAHGRPQGPDGHELDPADRWQPWLWQRLVDRLGDPTEAIAATCSRLADPVPIDGLPAPVGFFGLSMLPPRHLEVVEALADRAPVALFVPTPSPGRRGPALDVPPAHPLLHGCGRVADDAVRLLDGIAEEVVVHDVDTRTGPATPTLLELLQSGIRDDRLPAAPGVSVTVDGARAVEAADIDLRGVKVLRCHGPSRQADALRDTVLGLLDDDPTLEPRDVLVLCPDVDTFGPLVTAAFAADGDRPELPVQVADRRARRTDVAADALMSLLDLLDGRMSASAVLDLFAADPVARRLGLDRSALDQLVDWVTGSGVRWGVDAAHRRAHDQPPDRHHTWEAGLDRLLVGLAMADEDDRIVGDVVPFDHVEGGDAELVGLLAARCHALFAAAADARRPRRVADWCELVREFVDGWIGVDESDASWPHEFGGLLDDLADAAGAEPLSLDALRVVIESRLDTTRGAVGYETGAVTLCELIPMRSIPHRVVCVIGMDDGSFPRAAPTVGFDLVARSPRPGDPDKRDEDSHLFLEAMLAARQHLVVATTGRDLRTNEKLPPASVVAALLEAVERLVGRGAVDEVVSDEPLHPFSPTLFGAGGPARSFDVGLLESARRTRGERTPAIFVDGPLAAAAPGDVSFDDLAVALSDPVGWLVERRLRVRLGDDHTTVEDLDPLGLDGLDRFRLGSQALGHALDGQLHPAWTNVALARPQLPSGALGRRALEPLTDEVGRIAAAAVAAIDEFGDGHPQLVDDVAVDVEVGREKRRIIGTVAGVRRTEHGCVRVVADFRRMRAQVRLRLWVAHLALTASGVENLVSIQLARPSTADGPPARTVFGPFDGDDAAASARTLLADLVAVYDEAWCRPLPLFANASLARAEGRSHSQVRTAFWDGFNQRGDRDEAVELVYGEGVTLDDVVDQVGDEFGELAHRVFGPMLEHEARTGVWLEARTAGGDA